MSKSRNENENENDNDKKLNQNLGQEHDLPKKKKKKKKKKRKNKSATLTFSLNTTKNPIYITKSKDDKIQSDSDQESTSETNIINSREKNEIKHQTIKEKIQNLRRKNINNTNSNDDELTSLDSNQNDLSAQNKELKQIKNTNKSFLTRRNDGGLVHISSEDNSESTDNHLDFRKKIFKTKTEKKKTLSRSSNLLDLGESDSSTQSSSFFDSNESYSPFHSPSLSHINSNESIENNTNQIIESNTHLDHKLLSDHYLHPDKMEHFLSHPKLQPLHQHIALGNIKEAITLLQEHPKLISIKSDVILESGHVIQSITPYQLWLLLYPNVTQENKVFLSQDVLALMEILENSFDKINNGKKERQKQDRQCQAILEQMTNKKCSSDADKIIKNLIHSISKHSTDECMIALALLKEGESWHKDPKELNLAIKNFMDYFAPCTINFDNLTSKSNNLFFNINKNGVNFFNYANLFTFLNYCQENTMKLLDKNFKNKYKRYDLIWILLGQLMRNMPNKHLEIYTTYNKMKEKIEREQQQKNEKIIKSVQNKTDNKKGNVKSDLKDKYNKILEQSKNMDLENLKNVLEKQVKHEQKEKPVEKTQEINYELLNGSELQNLVVTTAKTKKILEEDLKNLQQLIIEPKEDQLNLINRAQSFLSMIVQEKINVLESKILYLEKNILLKKINLENESNLNEQMTQLNKMYHDIHERMTVAEDFVKYIKICNKNILEEENTTNSDKESTRAKKLSEIKKTKYHKIKTELEEQLELILSDQKPMKSANEIYEQIHIKVKKPVFMDGNEDRRLGYEFTLSPHGVEMSGGMITPSTLEETLNHLNEVVTVIKGENPFNNNKIKKRSHNKK